MSSCLKKEAQPASEMSYIIKKYTIDKGKERRLKEWVNQVTIVLALWSSIQHHLPDRARGPLQECWQQNTIKFGPCSCDVSYFRLSARDESRIRDSLELSIFFKYLVWRNSAIKMVESSDSNKMDVVPALGQVLSADFYRFQRLLVLFVLTSFFLCLPLPGIKVSLLFFFLVYCKWLNKSI